MTAAAVAYDELADLWRARLDEGLRDQILAWRPERVEVAGGHRDGLWLAVLGGSACSGPTPEGALWAWNCHPIGHLLDPALADDCWGLELALDTPFEGFFYTANGDPGSANAGKPLTFVRMPDAIDGATWLNDLLTNLVPLDLTVETFLPAELHAHVGEVHNPPSAIDKEAEAQAALAVWQRWFEGDGPQRLREWRPPVVEPNLDEVAWLAVVDGTIEGAGADLEAAARNAVAYATDQLTSAEAAWESYMDEPGPDCDPVERYADGPARRAVYIQLRGPRGLTQRIAYYIAGAMPLDGGVDEAT